MGKMTFRQRSKGSAKWVMKIIGGRAVQAERPPSAKDLRQERAQHGNTRSPCGCAVSPGEPSRGRRGLVTSQTASLKGHIQAPSLSLRKQGSHGVFGTEEKIV